MTRVLITGGSGLIGSRLTTLLVEKGIEVVHLERSPGNSPIKTYLWNVEEGTIDASALIGVNAIIHLAGASIGDGRWTARRKAEIVDSRVKSTRLLLQELGNNSHEATTFVCASAVGYYGGECGDEIKGEGDGPGADFLADVCRQWEAAASEMGSLGIRVVRMRTGIVLSPSGGALAPMVTQAKMGFAAPLGSGNQYMSWVHLDDLCRAYIYALTNNLLHGPYNIVAPSPVTNREFTKVLAHVMAKPQFMPAIPSFVLKLVLGEMSALVLEGCNVSSDKLRASGFSFRFEDVDTALRNVLSK